MLNSDTKKAQLLRFCINGGVAVAIQYGVYLLLIPYINEFVANTVAYIVSFAYNFIVTSYWTFHSRPSWKHLAGFSGSHVINYLTQQAVLALALWAGVSKELAALVAMAVAVPVNFLLLRTVYKKQR